MKKTLAILMAALMLLGLTACSSAPEATTEPAATAEQTEQTAAPAAARGERYRIAALSAHRAEQTYYKR